jgi:hypothetical protein
MGGDGVFPKLSRRPAATLGVKDFFIFSVFDAVALSPFLNLVDSTAILRRAVCGIQIALQESTVGA